MAMEDSTSPDLDLADISPDLDLARHHSPHSYLHSSRAPQEEVLHIRFVSFLCEPIQIALYESESVSETQQNEREMMMMMMMANEGKTNIEGWLCVCA